MRIGGQEKFETLNLMKQESWREEIKLYFILFTTLKN